MTNQSGIGRGYYSEQDFMHLSSWMRAQFLSHSIDILDVKYCPHHPAKAKPEYLKSCQCRKPQPGMILEAALTHQIDLKQSIMVGDKISDMECALNAGLKKMILIISQKLLESLNN